MIGVFLGGWQSESILHPQQFIVAHQEKMRLSCKWVCVFGNFEFFKL